MSEPTKLFCFLTCCLCACFVFVLVKLLNSLWWKPRRIQRFMASQGIGGPPYSLLHGNAKEMERMRRETLATPMELSQSHHTFPRILPHLYTWTRLFGTNFLIWAGTKPELVVTDPELVKVVLNNRDGVFEKPVLGSYPRKLLGDGLIVTAQREKWHKQRKLANHAFNTDSLKGMHTEMVTSVETMLERWRNNIEGDEIEVFKEFKLLTSEIISRTAFGSSYVEGDNILDMLTKLAQIVSRNVFSVTIPIIGKFVKTKDDIESDKLEQGLRDSIIKMIRKRVMNKDLGSDFLGSLLRAYLSDDKTKKISMDDLVDECKSFYVAGHETSVTWLGWTVLLLAIYPDWQDKAREEVLQVFGQENPSPQDLGRLTTMTMIMNESIRLYSPAVKFTRTASREVGLGDIIVPTNMEVTVSPLALHQNPKIWGEDFDMFKPERFAQGVAKATHNNTAAFIPFGLGARACVGQNFATNETKIALSMILQRYRFTLSPNYLHSPSPVVSIRPQHGLHILLHPL